MFFQIIVAVAIYIIIFKILNNNANFKKTSNLINNSKIVNKIDICIYKLHSKGIITKYNKKYSYYLIILVIMVFALTFLLFNYIFKIYSTAFIIALFSIFIPIAIYKIIIQNEKRKIIDELPNFVVNLKNNMIRTKNALLALSITEPRGVLKKYIDSFNNNIKKGVNLKDAIKEIKRELNLREINILFDSIYLCEINGGDCGTVLEKYLLVITEEIKTRELSKEKAYSSILTLVIMCVLNVYIMFSFTFSNLEYANIMRNSIIGKIIINLNVISYFTVIFLISKIYKVEEE